MSRPAVQLLAESVGVLRVQFQQGLEFGARLLPIASVERTFHEEEPRLLVRGIVPQYPSAFRLSLVPFSASRKKVGDLVSVV